MKLKIKIILLSFLFSLFLVIPSHAEIDFREAMEGSIIEACEAKCKTTGERYYCILSELYAFNKIISYYREYYNTPHLDVFDEIWENNYNRAYSTYNFVIIEKGIRAYLENLE